MVCRKAADLKQVIIKLLWIMSKAGHHSQACNYYSSLWLVVWVMRGMVRSFCCHNLCMSRMLQPRAACSACIAAFACNVHIWMRRYIL